MIQRLCDWDVIGRSGLLARVIVIAWIGSLASCHSPPHPEAQPPADWSDPHRQGRVEIEVIRCQSVVPWRRDPRTWILRIEARVTANSKELASCAAYRFGGNLAGFASRVALLRKRDGARVPIDDLEEPWSPLAGPPVQTSNPEPCATPPQQLQLDSWESTATAMLFVGECPTGKVELAFDSDALRREMDAVNRFRGDPMGTVPVGGLTAKSSVLRVPEPKVELPGASDKPQQSGAVLGPGGRVGSGE